MSSAQKYILTFGTSSGDRKWLVNIILNVKQATFLYPHTSWNLYTCKANVLSKSMGNNNNNVPAVRTDLQTCPGSLRHMKAIPSVQACMETTRSCCLILVLRFSDSTPGRRGPATGTLPIKVRDVFSCTRNELKSSCQGVKVKCFLLPPKKSVDAELEGQKPAVQSRL